MFVFKNTILELIPQRPPMVMVDRLLHCDESRAVTALKIRENINQFGNLTNHLAVHLNFIFKHIDKVTSVHPGYQFTKA